MQNIDLLCDLPNFSKQKKTPFNYGKGFREFWFAQLNTELWSWKAEFQKSQHECSTEMKQETWVGEKTVIWVLWHFSSDLWLQLNTCGEFSVLAFWILNSAQICCGIFKEPLYTLELFFYNIDDWNKTKHLRKDKSNGNDYDKKSMKLLMTMAMTLKILSMMMIVMSIIIGDDDDDDDGATEPAPSPRSRPAPPSPHRTYHRPVRAPV